MRKPLVVTPEIVLKEVPFGTWQCLLIVAGCAIQMSDGMQVTLLAFLYQCAGSTFHLDSTRAAMLVAIVFAGEFFAAVTSGPLSDAWGRRKITLATGFLLTAAGAGSALAPDFWVFIAARFIVGCAVGLYPVNFDLYAELLGPYRAVGLSITTASFPLGAVFCTAAAWLILPNWRVLTAVCSIPAVVGFIAMLISVEESPQFLLAKGQTDEALRVLTRIVGEEPRAVAALDKFADTLDYATFDKEDLGMSVLMGTYPTRLAAALTLWSMLGTTYGFQVLAGRFFNEGNEDKCNFDYRWIVLGYFLGFAGAVTIPPLVLDRIGRIPLIISGLLVTTISLMMIALDLPRPVHIFFMCLVFVANNVAWTGGWVITPELFDTSVRATAHTACFAAARVSAFVFTAVFGYELSIRLLATAMAGLMFVAFIATLYLPETRNTQLR